MNLFPLPIYCGRCAVPLLINRFGLARGQPVVQVRARIRATFNNSSDISWRSVLLVKETGENHRPVVRHWQYLKQMIWRKNIIKNVEHNKTALQNDIKIFFLEHFFITRKLLHSRIISLRIDLRLPEGCKCIY